MKTKLVTAYWLDAEGPPFQGTRNSLSDRYLGSLISHCNNIDLPIVCYTHMKNINELTDLKDRNDLFNLEIKLLELSDMKLHEKISSVRDRNYMNELDGRGPEIMWGKFQVLEQELDGFDMVYWIDVGMQYPGTMPWMFNTLYADAARNLKDGERPAWADNEMSQYSYKSLFNTDIFVSLNKLCIGKMFNVVSSGPQTSYDFFRYAITTDECAPPYPWAGVFGGDVKACRKYLDVFWRVCDMVLEKGYYCTEESIMKLTYDLMDKDDLYCSHFDCHYFDDGNKNFHFNLWNPSMGKCKPLYMVWVDLLNLQS